MVGNRGKRGTLDLVKYMKFIYFCAPLILASTFLSRDTTKDRDTNWGKIEREFVRVAPPFVPIFRAPPSSLRNFLSTAGNELENCFKSVCATEKHPSRCVLAKFEDPLGLCVSLVDF